MNVNFALSDLYDSHLAAENYRIHGLEGVIFEYIRRSLSPANICVIYDQLVKIEMEEELMARARTVVIERSKEVFGSEHFTQIGQETLISLLSLEELNIDEFDLFKAVAKWVYCEVQRQDLPVNRENRRRVFEPIKGYILFKALTPEQVARCQEIDELLQLHEIGSLLLHLQNPAYPYSLEPRTARRAGRCITRNVSVRSATLLPSTGSVYSREMHLIVNRSVYLKTIHTTYSSRNAANLTLAIFEGFMYQAAFVRRVQGSLVNGRCCFVFDPPFCLEPLYHRGYKLLIVGPGNLTEEDRVSNELVLNFEDSVVFHLNMRPYSQFQGNHFIQSIDFEKINRF